MKRLLGLITGGWGSLAGWGAATVAALGAAVAAYQLVRSGGMQAQQLTDLKARDKARGKADAAQAEVADLPDRAAVDQLHLDFDRKH